jgi:hypothetical protein
MSDRLTFACSQCRSPFSADRQLLGQSLSCPSCGAICPLPREAIEIPPHDPRETDRLLERVVIEQREANRWLGRMAFWVTVFGLLTLVGVCGGVLTALKTY